MLGVFLLPAFTRLGLECQDLLSPCDGMHVCKNCTLIRESFGGMESEMMGKIPLYRKKSLLRGSPNPRRCIKQNCEPNTLPTSYSDPHSRTHTDNNSTLSYNATRDACSKSTFTLFRLTFLRSLSCVVCAALEELQQNWFTVTFSFGSQQRQTVLTFNG